MLTPEFGAVKNLIKMASNREVIYMKKFHIVDGKCGVSGVQGLGFSGGVRVIRVRGLGFSGGVGYEGLGFSVDMQARKCVCQRSYLRVHVLMIPNFLNGIP